MRRPQAISDPVCRPNRRFPGAILHRPAYTSIVCLWRTLSPLPGSIPVYTVSCNHIDKNRCLQEVEAPPGGELFINQPEGKIARRSGNCDILLPADHITHRRGSPVLIRRKMPQRLSILRIQRRENSAVLTEEDQPPASRQCAARASSIACLGIVPNSSTRLNIQSADIPLPTGHSSACSVKKALTQLEGLRNLSADITGFARGKEEQFGDRAVGGGHPVGPRTGTSQIAFGRRLGVRNQDRLSVFAVSASPGDLLQKWLC